MSAWEKIRKFFVIEDPDGIEETENPEEFNDDFVYDRDEEYEEPERRGWFSFSKREPKRMVMYIDSPRSYSDAQRITDHLINGDPVVVNFGQFDDGEAQRIIDFISGCIYTLNGSYQRVSGTVFVFAPKNVRFEISEDEVEELKSNAG